MRIPISLRQQVTQIDVPAQPAGPDDVQHKEADGGQDQAEHSDSAVYFEAQAQEGPAELQLIAQRFHVEYSEIRIDGANLALNPAYRVRSGIRPRHDGQAAGRRARCRPAPAAPRP
jgi:hypothetical protein